MSSSSPLRHGALLVLLMAIFFAPLSHAQTFGNVRGSVADEDGTRLPGATVTIAGVGAQHIAITDGQGEYRFLNLDPGDYSMTAALDGYSTIDQPAVVVSLNRNTIIHFTLTAAAKETITVTSESPLLDERILSKGALISRTDLETIPTSRDPWTVLNQAPGVLTDRINVGGSESGSQMVFNAPGAEFFDNDWKMDGIQITDASSPGFTTTYFDFDQFESIDLNTGGPDVTTNTSGVAINMVTKRGTNEFRGSARFFAAKGDGLGFLGSSSSDLSCGDLPETQDCDSLAANAVNDISEYGFEAGGAAILDRLWLWGSYGVQDIDRTNASGSPFVTSIENVMIKVNGQLSTRNSAVASWTNGNKVVAGRGDGPTRAPEATQDQRGPSAYLRVEDTHVFGSNLFVTGSFQKSDMGFQLKPRSGCLDASCPLDKEVLWDSDSIVKQNFENQFTRQPERAVNLNASWFFGSGSVSHELKFGGRWRDATGFENKNYPGRDIIHIAGENFGNAPGPIDFFLLYRGPDQAEVNVEYNSLWVQDTIATGAWTINLGLRYDLQDGVNEAGTTGPSPIPEIFPEVVLEKDLDPGFDWETITPRIGATYAVGEDRDTLLRASFSQFPEALGKTEIAHLNPMLPGGFGSYAYFLFFDFDNDNQWNGAEPYAFLFGVGYDLQNPTTTWATVDPGYDPELTSELVVGVEHSFLPELVAGLSFTRREVDDVKESREYVRPRGAAGQGVTATADDYVLDGPTSAELPDGSQSEVPVYALDPSLEFSGFTHLMNGSRSREYDGLSLTVNKRLANQWSLRGYLHWGETEWSVPADYTDNSDPTDARSTADNDGGTYHIGGASRSVLEGRWQWSLAGIYQVAPTAPWGFNLAANLYGREGSGLLYNNQVNASDGVTREVSHIGGNAGRFRNDDVTTVDLRAEKTFGVSGNINFTFSLDLFNALNEATVLTREDRLNRFTADWANTILAPRIWKLGVRVSWK